MGISFFQRYPLFVATLATTYSLVALLILSLLAWDEASSWLMEEFSLWLAVLVVVFLLCPVVSWFVTKRNPLLNSLLVVVIPNTWIAHARAGGLVHARFHKEEATRTFRVVKQISVHPKIQDGQLAIPIRTNDGGLSTSNAENYGASLCDILGMASFEVRVPDARRNLGYLWFQFALEDATEWL
ncbi:hypothetical protein G7Y29_00585 [Corynebacterium qintianiae]|uniref:Uncharacterized protein n=1 Tax=Corynebacterium qintianiae TaxID=2709392 RepID=A0A7T0KMA6_9CORY|nr:hypothetical protein [Corynebacterium qintianiae]QPK83363.1 hypothetical protein G7Y29_00585 [Corynebacterium qintianiae]